MKKIVCVLFLIIVFSCSIFASDQEKAVVAYEGRGDYYILYANSGYLIVEAYGCCLYEDDIIIGEIKQYGFVEIYNITRDSEIRVYIEDYMMSENSCIRWMREHDKIKD